MHIGIKKSVQVPIAMAAPATKNAFSYDPDIWKIPPEVEKNIQDFKAGLHMTDPSLLPPLSYGTLCR
jgi:hypothetical protein